MMRELSCDTHSSIPSSVVTGHQSEQWIDTPVGMETLEQIDQNSVKIVDVQRLIKVKSANKVMMKTMKYL